MVQRRRRSHSVLPSIDTAVGWRHAVVQASVLGTFVASSGSTTLPFVAVPTLVLACYIDARLAPLVPILTIVFMVANGMSYDPVPAVAGALAGLTASPWALVATTLWAVLVATSIFTLATLEEPLWISAVVAVVAAAGIAGTVVWHTRKQPTAVQPDIEQGELPAPPQLRRKATTIQTHMFL